MSPRAARSRLHVRVRADVHAAALLRACSCRGLRRTLPPHAAAVAVVRTSQRRRCSDCAAPPRVPLLPVPCGCHSHLRCLHRPKRVIRDAGRSKLFFDMRDFTSKCCLCSHGIHITTMMGHAEGIAIKLNTVV